MLFYMRSRGIHKGTCQSGVAVFVLICVIVALGPYFYVDATAVSDMYNKLQKLEDEKTEQLLSCPRTYCVDDFLLPLEWGILMKILRIRFCQL